MWTKVPVYPRDILGEAYRDQWRDVYARPMEVKVEIPKNIVKNHSNFKTMPRYMWEDSKPEQSGVERVSTMLIGDAFPSRYSQ